jgi:hypothetical protein
MSESEQSPSQPQSYNFHDPLFVEWWLRSLYLMPAQQQVAAAYAIKNAVSVPSVHAEADLFLAELGEGPLASSIEIQDAAPTAPSEDEWHDVVVGALRRLWRERPAVIWLGVISLVVLVMRGVQALMKLFT